MKTLLAAGSAIRPDFSNGSVYTASSMIVFDDRPLEWGDIIVLAPELPRKTGTDRPAAKLVGFDVWCERLDQAREPLLRFTVGALNAAASSEPTDISDALGAVFAFPDIVTVGRIDRATFGPHDAEFERFCGLDCAFGLKVVSEPGQWCGAGKILMARFKYEALKEHQELAII